MAERKLKAVIESSFDDKGTKAAQKGFKDIGEAGEQSAHGTGKAAQSVSGLDGALTKIITAGLLVQGTRMLINFGKQAIATASGVEEMNSKFNVVFGESAPQATRALERFGDEVNRSKFDLMDMASGIQDTFVPLGFARDQAAQMSIELVKLATDVASFNNQMDADVMRDFQSALVGNHETVRKYGIVITETTLKAEMQRMGMDDLTGAALEQAKVQARLNLIMAGTSDAHGDAARTAGSYENMQKGLAAATKDLVVVIGQGLIPIAKDATQVMMQLTKDVLPAAKAWAALSIAVDDGRISQLRANFEFAKMVYTGKDANDILEEFGDTSEDTGYKVDVMAKRVEDATFKTDDLIKSTADAAMEAASADANMLKYAYTLDLVKIGTDNASLSQEEFKNALSDIHTLMAGALGKEIDTFNQRQEDLRNRAAEVNAKIDELERKSYLTGDQKEQLQDLKGQYDEIIAKIEEEKLAHEKKTKTILFNLIEEGLALSDVPWDEQIRILSEIQKQWGLVDEATSTAMQESATAIDRYLIHGSLAELIIELDRAKDHALGLEGDYNMNFRINWIQVGNPPGELMPEKTNKGPGGQTGLDFMVQSGFANDSFPVWVSSGERVRVETPAQMSGGGGGGNVIHEGDTNITQIFQDEGAAALGMAAVFTENRRNRNAWMGG